MKTLKPVIFLILFLAALPVDLLSQDETKSKSAFEIGIDFARFNRNWVYPKLQYPTDGQDYAFDFIPSIFAKIYHDKFSVRLKYEYLSALYSSRRYSLDSYRNLEGRLNEHRILFGLERNLINKTISIYYLSDFGVSYSRFGGKYIQSNEVDFGVTTEYFNIDQYTIFIQPGIGLKCKLTNRLAIKIESAVFIGKGFENPDKDYILPNSRFTPRPISAFGLSYRFN